MDRKTQIEFIEAQEGRVRSYVTKWLENPAVREALERRRCKASVEALPTAVATARKI